MKVRLMSGAAYRGTMAMDERGSLDRALRPAVIEYLEEQMPELVIVGDANGVDQWVREWCHERGVDLLVGEALWNKFGKRAGMRRNLVMLDTAELHKALGRDTRCGAAPGPKSVGTWAMVDAASAAFMPVDMIGPWGNG